MGIYVSEGVKRRRRGECCILYTVFLVFFAFLLFLRGEGEWE